MPLLCPGLLTSEPVARKRAALSWAMERLLWMAAGGPAEGQLQLLEDEGLGAAAGVSREARVHALNILKAVFRDTGLGEATMAWVGRVRGSPPIGRGG